MRRLRVVYAVYPQKCLDRGTAGLSDPYQCDPTHRVSVTKTETAKGQGVVTHAGDSIARQDALLLAVAE